MDHQSNKLYHSRSSAPLGGWIRPDGSSYAPQVIFSPIRLENINCIVEADGSRGAIFLGDIISAKKEDLLKQHNIRAVLSCAIEAIYNQADSPNHKVEVTLALAAEDLYTYDISQHFEEAIGFIEDQTRLGRNVLVHCHAGVSRSAAILAAFLIRNRRCSAEEAITFIRLKRPRAKPNEAFYHQLRNFAEKDQLISTDVSEQTTPTKDTIDTSPKKEEPPLLERISNWFSQATPQKNSTVKEPPNISESGEWNNKASQIEERLKAIDKMLEIQVQQQKSPTKTPTKTPQISAGRYQTPTKKTSEQDASNAKPRVHTLGGASAKQHSIPQPFSYPQNTYPYKVQPQYQQMQYQPFRHDYVVQAIQPLDSQTINSYEDQRRKALGNFFKPTIEPNAGGYVADPRFLAPNLRPISRAESFHPRAIDLTKRPSARLSDKTEAPPLGHLYLNGYRPY